MHLFRFAPVSGAPAWVTVRTLAASALNFVHPSKLVWDQQVAAGAGVSVCDRGCAVSESIFTTLSDALLLFEQSQPCSLMLCL